MQEHNLFLLFIRPLSDLGVPYMVTGSVAAMLYGEPRLTHDVDIVLEIGSPKAATLQILFPAEEFYCPPDEVIRIELARDRRGHFNLIHHESGFKADIYLCGDEPLHHWGLERALSFEIEGLSVQVAPPEYVIIKKLLFYREGGSEKHLRDIHAMLRMSSATIDRPEIERWIEILSLGVEWRRVTENS